jgi:TPR repeat protein
MAAGSKRIGYHPAMRDRPSLAVVGGIAAILAAVAWGAVTMLPPGAERIEDPYEQGLALHNLGEFKAAGDVWVPAAIGGDVRSMAALGDLYREGVGVALDEDEAFAWTLAAAEQGDARSQYEVGRAYEAGRGIAFDPDAALEWYERAAAAGESDAQVTLGVLLRTGLLGAPDPVEALAWLRVAAESGDPRGIAGAGELSAILSADDVARAEALARVLEGGPER